MPKNYPEKNRGPFIAFRMWLIIVSVLCALGIMWPVITGTAYAAEVQEIPVDTEEAFRTAIERINADDTGDTEYTIRLTDDITLRGERAAQINTNNTINLLGGGHTLVIEAQYGIMVQGTAVLNLGGEDYEDTLTILGVPHDTSTTTSGLGRQSSFITISDGCTLNMYDGVTLSDNEVIQGGTAGAGVTVQYSGRNGENSTIFNMYGGAIKNNTTYFGLGAGVSVMNNSSDRDPVHAVFNMYGGLIEGNTIQETSGGYVNGAGVYSQFGTFNMYGGVIRGNTAPGSGGGICILHGAFTMTAGTVEENTSQYGAGVYLSNSSVHIQAAEGNSCIVQNNKATHTTEASYGGGFYLSSCENAVISGVEITGNTVDTTVNNGQGGAAYFYGMTGLQIVNPRSHLYGLAIQDFPAHSQPIYTTLTPKSTTWSPDNKSQVGPVLPV